jgi:hypothetical protein
LLVPAAIASLSVMMLQKQIIRPGIESQVLAVLMFGLALLVVQQLRLRPAPVRYAAWALFSATLVVSCFTWRLEANRQRVESYLDVVSGLVPDLEYSVFASEQWTPARTAYFAASSIVVSGMPGDEFANRVRQITGMAATDSIFVLGDNALLFMILRRPTAFYANLFNQSPVFCQEKTMSWMDQYDPRFLFWDPAEKSFDGVPNPVRVPLLFNRAVAQFVPVRDPWTPRDSPQTSAVGGTGGRLLAGEARHHARCRLSSGDDACARGSRTMRYAVTRVAAPMEGAVYSVVLRLAGRPYTVQFHGRDGVTDYAIAIDRLPFASAGDALGVSPAVESSSRGVAVVIKTLHVPRERLY